MQEWLKGAYADVFKFVDPSEDDEIKITDAFRPYQPAGQQRRMVILFRELCTAAGLAPAKAPGTEKPTRVRLPLLPRPVSRVAIHKPAVKPALAAKSLPAPSALPPALAGLMDSLPDAKTGWTKAERSKFLATFEAVLDFCIPVVTKSDKSDEEAA
jgi:hypothetical protein